MNKNNLIGNNSNHKNQNKKFNLPNMLYKKNTNDEGTKKNPLGELLNSDNKLNKTSINLSSSDTFNLNIDYQEPIPIEIQLKQFNINSGEIVSNNNIEVKSFNQKDNNEELNNNSNEKQLYHINDDNKSSKKDNSSMVQQFQEINIINKDNSNKKI